MSKHSDVVEWTGPTLVTPEPFHTIPWLLEDRVKRLPDAPLMEIKTQLGGNWRRLSAKQFAAEVKSVAAGFIGMGLQTGDRIAIMSRTCYEWTLLDIAALSAGLVVVPIYETDSAEQIGTILEDADPRIVITETIVLARLVRSVRQKGKNLQKILTIEDGALVLLVEAGRGVVLDTVDQRTKSLTADTLATIVYTSGTSGKPKGTCLTHGNFAHLVINGQKWMPEIAHIRSSRLLLFLPLAHVYARFLQLFQISGGGVLGHTPDTSNLLADLAKFRPTYILAVPRVLEKIYNAAEAKARSSRVGTVMFANAVKVAIAYSHALDTEDGPSRSLRAKRQLFERLVYRKITKLLGPNARWVISGGAPLGARLGHFFRGMGIPVLEGYGLTETTAPLAVNTPRLTKVGTVGPPIATITVKIAEDGEILLKGPSVFKGYHNLPEETKAAFTADGWFRSGDLGSLDMDGYLSITGRAKEIIVTAGGKNVVPSILEDSLRGHPLISQTMVVGDNKPFIAALVTLNAEMLPTWLRNHNLPQMDVSDAVRHPQVLAALERAIERANKQVSRAESIRKFKVLLTDFTVENGLLTPSMKVIRREVAKRFAAEIEDLYAGVKSPEKAQN
ncbi:MAG: long-chain fatty acid--CoA ligase [Actinomycetaceae bacterium]|nr:long-chain fatty acid--CoA ligase [Actinomycetaceae bacterium]